MRKALFAFIFLITPLLIFAQDIDDDETISGQVVNASNDAVLDNVNIINLNNVKGAISDEKGNFTIQAKVKGYDKDNSPMPYPFSWS